MNNNNNRLVSICIPAYNASKLLPETLESIRFQNYQNWELIVVEDGTNDGTEEIVEQFRRSVSNRVFYISSKINLGPATSRNIAVKNSKGSWIAFIDSDDLWKIDHLSEMINTSIMYPDCDLIHSGVDVFASDTGEIIFNESLSLEVIAEFPVSLFDRRYGFQPSQVMVSRRLFDLTGGFDDKIRSGEDLEMWFRCAKAEFRFALSKKHTCLYRKHSTALSSSGLNMTLGCAEVYDMYSNWAIIPLKVRRKMRSQHWFFASKIIRKTDKKLAKRYLAKSLQYRLSFKQLFYWILLRII